MGLLALTLPIFLGIASYQLVGIAQTVRWEKKVIWPLLAVLALFFGLGIVNISLKTRFWDFSTSSLVLVHLAFPSAWALILGAIFAILEKVFLLKIVKLPKTKRRFVIIQEIIIGILLFFAALGIVLGQVQSKLFNGIQMELMLFYLSHDLAGTEWQSRVLPVTYAVLGFILLLIIFNIPLNFYWRKRYQAKIIPHKSGKEYLISKPLGFVWALFYGLVLMILPWALLLQNVGFYSYAYNYLHTSDIFEKNYVPPENVKLEFPQHKRNLVLIYSESLENTLISTQHGGAAAISRIPEMEEMALDPNNVSFTNKAGKIGGAQQTKGLGWSLAGLTASQGGLPLLRAELELFTRYQPYSYQTFLPGSYMLGQVLRKEGYNLSFLVAADRHFGGLDLLAKEHGDWKITDINTVRADGRVPPNYQVFWGFEDKKLFQFAREELENLSHQDKPFALTVFTADTHEPEGYQDSSCEQRFPGRYDNAYLCSSKKLKAFVDYIKSQPYGKDTTIVITGDHLGTGNAYYQNIIREESSNPNFQRTVYNLFVNSAVKPKSRVRNFTTFDYYPTILAAMGVKVDGNQMGLGVNLFSDKPTMIDKYGGLDKLGQELEYRSKYYNDKIFDNKPK